MDQRRFSDEPGMDYGTIDMGLEYPTRVSTHFNQGGARKQVHLYQNPHKRGKVPSALRPWFDHLQAFRRAHPNLSMKAAMKAAARTYHKNPFGPTDMPGWTIGQRAGTGTGESIHYANPDAAPVVPAPWAPPPRNILYDSGAGPSATTMHHFNPDAFGSMHPKKIHGMRMLIAVGLLAGLHFWHNMPKMR